MKKIISAISALALMATSLLSVASFTVSADEVIKVACVGDSITAGGSASNYPLYLQEMLGDGFEVKNFGKGGASVRHVEETIGDLNWGWGSVVDSDGDGKAYFYYDDVAYTSSLNYDADYVFVMMGTNDVGSSDYGYYKTDFYEYLVKPYLDNGSEVIVLTSPHAYEYMMQDHNKINTTIRQMQIELAQEYGLNWIDINTFTSGRRESFPDGLHGNSSGYMIIAGTVYREFFGGEVYNLEIETGESVNMTIKSDDPIIHDYVLTTDENGHGYVPVLPSAYTVTLSGVYVDTQVITVTEDMTFEFDLNVTKMNLAMLGTAYADSEHEAYTNNKTFKVNDGDINSRWQSNSIGEADAPAWIAIDFFTPLTFDKVSLIWEAARAPLNEYRIEYSDDGENWTEVTNEAERTREEGNNQYTDICTFDAVTARHIRIFCDSHEGYAYPSIWEFQVYNTTGEGTLPPEKMPTPVDPADSENLALNATAVSDSENEAFAGHTTSQVNDGSLSTRWQSNAAGTAENPAWIYLDFGKEVTFNEVKIVWELARSSVDGYTITHSLDGEKWEPVLGENRIRDTEADPQVDLSLFNEVTARYLRIYCTNPDNNKGAPSIWELGVYNIPSGEDNPPIDPPADVKLGDVNGDGSINSTDFMQVRRYYLSLYTFTDEQFIAADVNKDGTVNSTDFMQIRRHFLGLFTIGA